MASSRLKVNIKNILFDIIKIALTVCVIFGAIKFVPTFFKSDNITKKELPVVEEDDTITATTGKRGSIELLSIGNSCLYSAFNPMQLWKDYGITSYIAASPKQNMSVSYYMLKEILTVQNPKVVILEANAFFDSRGVDNESENKAIVYKNAYQIFRYSNRWNEVYKKRSDQSSFLKEKILTHGYYYKTEVVPYNGGMSYMKETTAKEELASYTQKYLPMIMELAKKNKIKVLFVNFPSQTAWNMPKHNTTVELSKKYNVPYIDYNVGDTLSGFDWKTDSRDGGNHLNYAGAKKMTKTLGQYLHKNYKLTDYRGNNNFADWDTDYKKFMNLVNE